MMTDNPIEKKQRTIIKAGLKLLKEGRNGFSFHEAGRLRIGEKVAFFSNAKKVMFEFRVTLNTFTSYFFYRNK